MTTIDYSAFDTPGRGRGILDVFRYRYLLRLLIGKSTSLRYRNSVLGWMWSYVRPTVQFIVYYFIVGEVLGAADKVHSYPLYLFSGIVVINLFNEAFGNATKSIVDNKALVRKIYLPRELFPIAAVVGSFIHFLPQLAVLLVVAIFFFGWVPSFASIGFALAGLLIVTAFVTGLGLLFSAVNVRFRDAQNFVEIIRTIATWTAPVMYTWEMVWTHTRHIPWLFDLYMCNPLTVAVEFFHRAFWAPTVPADVPLRKQVPIPPDFGWFTLAAVAIIIVVMVFGQFVFRRFERTFAQDL